MAIAVLNGASDSVTYNSGGTQVTSGQISTKPTNLADGDLLIAVVAVQTLLTAGQALTCDNASWVLAGPASQTTGSAKRPSGIWIYPIPNAAAVTPTNWIWRCPSLSRMIIRVLRVTGVDLASPIEVASPGWCDPQNDSGSTTLTMLTLTTANSDAMVVYHIHGVNSAVQGNMVVTAPTGPTFVEQINSVVSGSGSNDSLGIYTEQRPIVGAVPTRTFTTPVQAAFAGYQIALKNKTTVIPPETTTGPLVDRLIAFYKAIPLAGPTLQDYEYQWLASKTSPVGKSNADMQKIVLGRVTSPMIPTGFTP